MTDDFSKKLKSYIKKDGGTLEDALYQRVIKKNDLSEIQELHKEYVGLVSNEYADMFGDYMESERLLSKRSGQFFTPPQIVDFMVASSMGEQAKKEDDGKPISICDPACGTGRFMLGVKKHFDKSEDKKKFVMWNIDIDFRMFVFTTVNAVLNKINAVVVYGDALMNDFNEAMAVDDKGLISSVPLPLIKEKLAK